MTINRNNYQSYFLLYADRELKAEDRQMVEAFADRHPDLGKELRELMNTISVPPAIFYPDKENLYREERKRRIPLVWWSGIAAAVLVLLVSGWLLLLNAKKQVKTKAMDNSQAGLRIMPEKQRTADSSAEQNRTVPAARQIADAGKGREGRSLNGEKPGSRTLVLNQGAKSNTGGRRDASVKNSREKTTADQSGNGADPDEEERVVVTKDLPALAESRVPAFAEASADKPANASSKVDLSANALVKVNTPTLPPEISSKAASPAEASAKAGQSSTPGESSILIFNSENSPVSGLFNKTAKASPAAGEKTDRHRRRVNIGMFQFDLK